MNYYVKKSWSSSSLGTFTSLTKAKQVADINVGTFVFGEDHVPVYPVPFSIKPPVSLKIFSTADSSTVSTKQASTGVGVFTITKVASGRGYLKSGMGWVALADIPVIAIKTAGQKVAEQAAAIGKYMVTNKYHYGKIASDKGTPLSFAASKPAGYHNATCTRFASWALQEAGFLKEGKCLSHTMGNKDALINCEVINVLAKYGKKMTFQELYNKNALNLGDVMISSKTTCGSNYASVFAGYRDGKKCHYEAGGPFKAVNTTKTSPYIYTNLGPLYVSYDWTHYVEYIIRPKN